jgi:phage tail sheath gpL-like
MARAWYANNVAADLWLLPLADPGGGAAAEATITIDDGPTASGTWNVYIGGVHVPVAIVAGLTVAQVATRLGAAVNANKRLQCTAAVVDEVVTLTFVHDGTIGNGYDVRFNFKGSAAGEVTPAGLGYTLTNFTGGSGTVSLSTIGTMLTGHSFRWLVHPYGTTTPLDNVKTEMESRWNYARQEWGTAFSAYGGSYANGASAAAARNNKYEVLWVYRAGETLGSGTTDPRGEGARIGHPTPLYTWVAAHTAAYTAVVGVLASRGAVDVEVRGVHGCDELDKVSALDTSELLLESGASYSTVDAQGRVHIGDVILTYRLDESNAADSSWYSANVTEILGSYVLQVPKWVAQDFRNHLLYPDGARVSASVPVVTPAIAKAKAVEYYRKGEFAGVVQDSDAYERSIRVTINTDNPEMLDYETLPDLANAFKIGRWSVEFTR